MIDMTSTWEGGVNCINSYLTKYNLHKIAQKLSFFGCYLFEWFQFTILCFTAQYCPQNLPKPENHTIDNCSANWPLQHNVDDVQGLAPCLGEEDRNENFPCTSTKNINTMNECFSQSNVIFNHNNFIDVLDNSQFYNGLYLSHMHYATEKFKMWS